MLEHKELRNRSESLSLVYKFAVQGLRDAVVGRHFRHGAEDQIEYLYGEDSHADVPIVSFEQLGTRMTPRKVELVEVTLIEKQLCRLLFICQVFKG